MTAIIADQNNVNRVLAKVNLKESGVCYGHIGKKEELMLTGIGDVSFKMSEKAVRGMVLLLANNNLTSVTPIHWKSKEIERVCQSSKDAETLVMNRLVEDAVYSSRQIETMLFGKYEKRIPIQLFMDLEAMLESINSTK